MKPLWITALLAALLLATACSGDDPTPSGQDTADMSTPDSEQGDSGQPDLPTDEDQGDPDLPEGPDQGLAPEGPCQSDQDCDDGLGCTQDSCQDNGLCQWELREDACLIRGACYSAGQLHPEDPCQACNPLRPLAWVTRAEGSACDDGSACTQGDACTQGVCAGQTVTCDDGDPCTTDACDAVRGCLSTPAPSGTRCDDGDACTTGDVCIQGLCQGASMICEDDNPCTTDACVEGACTFTDNTESCDDGDPCTEGDTCVQGACQGGGPTNCDDGNFCTLDGCHELAGCYHLPTESPCCLGQTSICDDGNPCTTDACDPATGACLRTHNAARCDDGSACTQGDTCAEGTCNGQPITCQDNNGCTQDRCDDRQGCLFIPTDGATCDDGVQCTTGDVCFQGVCVGDDAACTCTPTFGDTATRLRDLYLSQSAAPGQALDVDRDGSLDNALGVLGSIINEPLQGAVQEGSLTLLLDFRGFDNNPFDLAAFDGELAPTNPDCAVQSQACDYQISDSLLDPDTCEPRVSLSATLAGDTVVAGGPGTVFPFEVPFGGVPLVLTLYEARIEGELTLEGQQVASFRGVLAGAIRKQELLATLAALPEDSLPFSPDAIAPLLDLLVTDDIDLDGDGAPDAASIAIAFDGIGARLTGVRP